MCNLMWWSVIEKQPDTFNFIAPKEIINNVRDITIPEMGKVHTDMVDFAVFVEKCPRLFVLERDDFNVKCLCRRPNITSNL